LENDPQLKPISFQVQKLKMDVEATTRRLDMAERLARLKMARGSATSMVTVLVAPHQQLSIVRAKLENELSVSVNIKDAHNRQSVQASLRNCISRLTMYKKVPENGIAIFSGVLSSERGRDERVGDVVEPLAPITHGLYRCGPSFYVEVFFLLLIFDRNTDLCSR
jgi:peptide chain release factor subunit 1